jgi:hypothetical protein
MKLPVPVLWSVALKDPAGVTSPVMGPTPATIPAAGMVTIDVPVPFPAGPAGRWFVEASVIPSAGEANLHTARRGVRAR